MIPLYPVSLRSCDSEWPDASAQVFGSIGASSRETATVAFAVSRRWIVCDGLPQAEAWGYML
jgi:hypothetical protein